MANAPKQLDQKASTSDKWATVADELRGLALPLAPTFVAASIPMFVGTPQVGLRYYEAVAQIIPLILIVLILEHRYFFRQYKLPPSRDYKSEKAQRRQDRIDRFMGWASPLFLLIILASGEAVALAGLASGHPNPELFQLTISALAGGFTAICLIAALGSRQTDRP